jgi:hypothetical protein
VSAAEGGKVHTDSLQVVLPYDIKTIEKLTPVAKVRFVRFLNTLTSNPYIIVQTYKEKGKGPKAVFVFSGVNGNRLVFDKLNTLGKYWNITLDLTNLGTTRHGFVSNIPSNNVLSQEALQNTLPLLSESDRLRHIQVALNTVKQLPMSMEFANIKPAQIITKEQTAASTPASQSTLPTASIKMQPNNIEKIKKGTKTTTTRSETQAKEINIPVGTSAIVTFGNERFIVTNRGLLTIQEAGGKDAVLKSEGVANESELMYQQTKDWVNGEGKLYVYDIAPATQPTTQQPDGTTPPTC